MLWKFLSIQLSVLTKAFDIACKYDVGRTIDHEVVDRYLLPATISFEKGLSIPIANNNSPSNGIGYYRLSIDLQLIVQGVITLSDGTIGRAAKLALGCGIILGFVQSICSKSHGFAGWSVSMLDPSLGY